jgi:hypothetical protein
VEASGGAVSWVVAPVGSKSEESLGGVGESTLGDVVAACGCWHPWKWHGDEWGEGD